MIDSGKSKSGLCTKCFMKKYRKEHKEEIKAYTKDYGKKYYQENKEWLDKINVEYKNKHEDKFKKIKHDHYKDNNERYKESARKRYEKDPKKRMEQIRIYHNKRYREDEGFRMRKKLGGALWKVIDYYIKTGKVINPCKKYNIDWEGIIKQLSPIPKNRSKYHVDHIIELRKFDLTNIEQIQIAFAPENHQWLKVKKNLIKGGRVKLLGDKE